MKFMYLILSFVLFVGVSARANTKDYTCRPFKGEQGKPSDYSLPDLFTLRMSASKTGLQIEVAGKTATLKEDPWLRKTINSDKYDRFTAGKVVSGIIVAKNAYKLPSHFTAKLDAEFDWFHGVHGWYGYNCR